MTDIRTDTKSAAAKLHIKPGHAIHVINRPDGYEDLVGGLPTLARVVDGPADADVVHLFVRSFAQLELELPLAIADTPPNALFWVSYPRKEADPSSDLNRGNVWKELVRNGLRPVSGITVDDTWSAIRGKV